MRLTFASLLLAISGLLVAPAAADPTSDLVQMQQAFAAAKSWHADMKTPQGKSIAIDMILPDKIHETMFNGMQVIMIGSDVWINPGSRWMKMPMVMPQMKTMIDSARNASLSGQTVKDYTVTDLGAAMLNGVPTHHYRVVSNKEKIPVEMWVGADHLPLQIQTKTEQGVTTIVYSKFNEVADIAPPM